MRANDDEELRRVRGEYSDSEFDFLAVDRDDLVAVFSAWSMGPIPVEILRERMELEEARVEAFRALDPVGEAEISRRARWAAARQWLALWHFARARRMLRRDNWEHDAELARRGAFTFDWELYSGPYRCVARPTVPRRRAELSGILANRPVLELDCSFARSRAIRLEDLVPCIDAVPRRR